MPAMTDLQKYHQSLYQQEPLPTHQQQQQSGQSQQHPYSQQQQQPAFSYQPSSSSSQSSQPSMSHSQHYQQQQQQSHDSSQQQLQQANGGQQAQYSNPYSSHMMARPQPTAAQSSPFQPSNPQAAYPQFNPTSYYQAMQPNAQLMHAAATQQQTGAPHPGQSHPQAQYMPANPYISQLSNAAQQRPLLVAGRVIPHPQFYPYELKPGRMPPFDILAAQLHKKKVNLACHFCDHAARRPGRQKTALLISCQSPHCRKVFCSRPSCFKKLPAELGIQSPDRFCEWKRQVESGVAGMTFICPHCRDEAGCPGPQCAKRWKKRLARANNKRGVNGEKDGEGEEATAEQPLKKEVMGGEGQADSNSAMNGVGVVNGMNHLMPRTVGADEEMDMRAVGPTFIIPSVHPMNMQQRSPTSLATAGAAAAYPNGASMYSVYQAGDPNVQPRSSMDVLAGVSEVQDGETADNGVASAVNESTPAAHQQLIEYLQRNKTQHEEQAEQSEAIQLQQLQQQLQQEHQLQQQQQQQQSQQQQQQQILPDQQSAHETSVEPATAPAGYTLTAYSATAPASVSAAPSSTSSAPPVQYAYNGSAGGVANGGQPFFTSPQLSPLMSPQPNALPVPTSIMSLPHFSSGSPSLGPLSPMTHNQSPATAFYSSTAHLIPSVPSLSLAAGNNAQPGANGGAGEDGTKTAGQEGDHHGNVGLQMKLEQDQNANGVQNASSNGESISVA